MRRLILALTLAGTAAAAQGVDDLPDRPIARREVVAVVKRQFAAMDANRDGVVTQREFETYRAAQARAPNRDGELAVFDHVGGRWFERADTEGTGRITLAQAEARPLRLFDTADANGDGVVSVEEKQLASLLMGLSGR